MELQYIVEIPNDTRRSVMIANTSEKNVNHLTK